MKKILALSLMAALPAFAANKSTTKTTAPAAKATPAPVATEAQSTAPSSTSGGIPLYLAASPSLIAGYGGAAPGIDLQFSIAPISSLENLAFTLDAGPYFHSFTDPVALTSSTVVFAPIMAGAEWRFDIPSMPNIRPIAGLSTGVTVGGGTAAFTLMFRPGVDIGINNWMAVNIEPRFGLISSSFVFAGQAGLRFSL